MASGDNTAAATVRRLRHHLPAFVRAAYEAIHSPGFEALAEVEQIERLIAASGAGGASLSGYCSLNLYALSMHGTLEFRRFHGTVDAGLLTRWAHFCVSLRDRVL